MSLLVGRSREQAILSGVLAEALAGRGSLVLLSGEAGIGKTALAEWLLSEAKQQGAQVLRGRCFDLSETPPYGPWTGAFGCVPYTANLPPLPAAVLPPDSDGETVVSRQGVSQSVLDHLNALATRQPIVLFLDDLHWADHASLDLLRFVGRSLTSSSLLAIAAYRADEMARDHPLYTLIPLLVREANTVSIDLHPLDRAELKSLARQYTLPRADEDRLTNYLVARSDGNPFFAGELLRSLGEERILRPRPDITQASGIWWLGDLTSVRIPRLLRQVIDGRVVRLGEDAVRMLALAAVIGQEVPLPLLAAVAQETEETLLVTMERAAEARIVEVFPDRAQARFNHALVREALYEGATSSQRRAWHQCIAEALAAQTGADPDAVAYHFRRAGDSRAAEWLLKAAERAQAAYAWTTAALRLEAAIPLLHGDPATAQECGWRLLQLAALRRYDGTSQSLDDVHAAIEVAQTAGDDRLAAHAKFTLGHALANRRLIAEGVALTGEALAALETLPPASGATLARLSRMGLAADLDHFRGTHALFAAVQGRHKEALRIAEAVVARLPMVVRTGWLDPIYAADALDALGMVYSVTGEPEAARRMFRRLGEVYRSTGDTFQVAASASKELYVVLAYQADDLTARRALIGEMLESLVRANRSINLGIRPRHTNLWFMLVEGQWDDLWDACAEQRARSQILDPRFMELFGGQLARHRGDYALARSLLHDILPNGAATEPGQRRLRETLLLLALGSSLALDFGNPDEARRWLVALDRWLEWGDAVRGKSERELGWAEYHRTLGDLAEARERAERALACASEPRQPLALIAAHRILGEIDTVRTNLPNAQAHLDAALAIAEACAAPYERALTLIALAELRLATGQPSEARKLLDTAQAICARLGARPALDRIERLSMQLRARSESTAAYPVGLSSREVEVLRLLAAGRTNQQIASALSLSERTIHAHVRSIFTKTGTDNRAAATAFAFRHNLT